MRRGRIARRTRAVASRPSAARIEDSSADATVLTRRMVEPCRSYTTMVLYQHGSSPVYRRGARSTMAEREYEFGLDSFMALTADAAGNGIRGDQVVRNTVEEGVLAE